jgi:hypothetical protein
MCRLEFQQVEKAKFTGVRSYRSSGVAGERNRDSVVLIKSIEI